MNYLLGIITFLLADIPERREEAPQHLNCVNLLSEKLPTRPSVAKAFFMANRLPTLRATLQHFFLPVQLEFNRPLLTEAQQWPTPVLVPNPS